MTNEELLSWIEAQERENNDALGAHGVCYCTVEEGCRERIGRGKVLYQLRLLLDPLKRPPIDEMIIVDREGLVHL